jgi:hypothetical protein
MHLLVVNSVVADTAVFTHKESIQRNLQFILLVTAMESWNVLGSDVIATPSLSGSVVDLSSVAGWEPPIAVCQLF